MDRKQTIACFTRNLVWLRKTHKLSSAQMARLLEITPQDLRLLEKGVLPQDLSVTILFRLHAQFGYSEQELLSCDLSAG